MELRHLRYFVIVAAHGSFNRAARILHLTQPALSRQVKDLEEELGVPLFDRGKNAVKLTEAGARFYDEAREVLARAELAVQRARGESGEDVLRVAYAPSATAGILPRVMQRFQTEHPKVRIELSDVSPPEMIRMAIDGRLDLIVALEPSVTATVGFQWTELRHITHVLVMGADHPLAKLKRIAPARLRDLALVGLGPPDFPDYVAHVQRLLKPFGFGPSFVALEPDGVSTLFASLEAYQAAAILADSVAEFMPRSLVCRPFSPKFAPMVAKIGVSATRPNPHAETFATLLREEVQQVSRKPRQ
ncbi:LysR family transcriptional regulator [Actomonas aquatica]|uniref:LysR substrate-binding domain-containing protein n=1 Tax=Actomonas aquatica TaxID=2866162 RepID=A0ABZ1C5I1_9BACT|nr:LysR substrate-binding domain-containing protein [Opitutus sp. WL0086]WRQ85779.1 LysR substrate-binding domain-containing protein [Opitutus sp. WL0086]